MKARWRAGRGETLMDAERHEEIARSLFREANDGLFLFDPNDHRVLDVNPAAMRLTGFAKDQARGLRVWDLFSGQEPSALDSIIEAYRRTGFYHSREGFFLRRREGDPIPVNLSVTRIHTRPEPLGLVVARDVTERKRVEEALRESERRYRSLVETAQVLLWTTDAEGRITSLSEGFFHVLGEASPWVGRPLTDMVEPDDRHALGTLMSVAREGGTPNAVDVRVRAASGGARVLEFLSASRFDDGPVPGLSGIARDATEARAATEAARLAEQDRRAREVAESADRAKSRFLAAVSHEIRTPMTAILGFTDLLLNDPDVRRLPPPRLDDLRTIAQSGAHLLDLIDDILDISKIEAGKLRVEPAPCSPSRIVAEVLATLRSRAEDKGLLLSQEAGGPIPEAILTDRVRLRQILINLVGNAIKFTERGSVRVRLELVPGRDEGEGEDEPGFAIDEDGPSLRIDVIDTGPGITEAEQALLFEPFSRPVSSARQSSGHGLGLAISRRLAEMLGGELTVLSAAGEGSTFRLSLPAGPVDPFIAPPESGREADRPAPPPDRPPPSRILLAEDNSAVLRVTTLHLEQLGAQVVSARNGQQAIDLALDAQNDGQPFDVVLMDMQMPVIDGYEATRQLRARGFTGRIIALTAYAMPEDREECLRLGCDEHVSKPVDWARLAELLHPPGSRPR